MKFSCLVMVAIFAIFTVYSAVLGSIVVNANSCAVYRNFNILYAAFVNSVVHNFEVELR